MIGQRVNNFSILRLLGEGGMGAVYEAEHPTLGRKVAVKVLRPALAADPEQVQRFFNEARAANAIRHPNIIQVLDLGLLQDGVPYLVMELLEGESLARRLARVKTMETTQAVAFTVQAGYALEAAHANGIVHRDLKPDNLFVIADQRFAGREMVKVLDFGIAKLRADLSEKPLTTLAGVLFGTPPYMSPEQCRGLATEVDRRADVYALGIILYEMLCGRPPFVSDAPGDVMMMHMGTDPTPPSSLRPDLRPHLDSVILKALAKRREDRFSSMSEFTTALLTMTTAIVTSPTTVPLTPRPVPWPISVPAAPAADAGPVPAARVGGWIARTWARRGSVWRPAAAIVAGSLVVMAATAILRSGKPSPTRTTPPTASKPRSISLTPLVLPARKPVDEGGPSLRAIRRIASERTRPARRPPGPPRSHAVAAGPAQDQSPAIAPPDLVAADPAARPAVEPGYLNLDSAPWSNVSLAGRALGTTPVIRLSLPPGKHVLTLTNPELGISTSYAVEIRSGATVSRFVGLDKQ